MKTCSSCGNENADDEPRCGRCGIELPQVQDSGAAFEDPGERLVVLARCRTVIDANLIRLRLESAGIDACVPEELTPQIFWYAVPSPLEEVTVRVRTRDLEAARAVLADTGAGTPPPIPS
ncbi:MAG: putative prokaryotic signal transducing protein [Verrucomicrobiota bacterium]|jgi:hypothetical protein